MEEARGGGYGGRGGVKCVYVCGVFLVGVKTVSER